MAQSPHLQLSFTQTPQCQVDFRADKPRNDHANPFPAKEPFQT